MKITFLMPPALDGTRAADRLYGCNYGIYFLPHVPTLYCATLLAQKGFDVNIIDFAAEKKTVGDFKNFVVHSDSDLYVFYTVFLSEETDLIARSLLRGTKVPSHFVFCGTQPTWAAENFLDSPDTFVIRGEPEFTLLELASALQKGEKDYRSVRGLSFVKDGEVVHNPEREPLSDLDSLPIPDRRLLDHARYFNPKMHKAPHTAMITSRGCHAQCRYCVPNSLSFARELEYKSKHGKKPVPRVHSAERVISEFKAIKKLGFRSVSICDDLFVWGEKRTVVICNGIRDLGLEWSCLTRADTITEKIAEAMAEAGCLYVDIGVESFNQAILDSVRKDLKIETIYRAMRILKKAGIQVELNILLGATPEETEDTINETIKAVKDIDADYVLFSIAAPFPGTDFYYEAKQQGWLIDGEYRAIDPQKEAIISYPGLSKEKLERLVSKAYRQYYFNIKYIAKQLVRINSIEDLGRKVDTAIKMFRRNVLKRS